MSLEGYLSGLPYMNLRARVFLEVTGKTDAFKPMAPSRKGLVQGLETTREAVVAAHEALRDAVLDHQAARPGQPMLLDLQNEVNSMFKPGGRFICDTWLPGQAEPGPVVHRGEGVLYAVGPSSKIAVGKSRACPDDKNPFQEIFLPLLQGAGVLWVTERLADLFSRVQFRFLNGVLSLPALARGGTSADVTICVRPGEAEASLVYGKETIAKGTCLLKAYKEIHLSNKVELKVREDLRGALEAMGFGKKEENKILAEKSLSQNFLDQSYPWRANAEDPAVACGQLIKDLKQLYGSPAPTEEPAPELQEWKDTALFLRLLSGGLPPEGRVEIFRAPGSGEIHVIHRLPDGKTTSERSRVPS